MYFDSEEAHARIGSCSVSKEQCESWREKSKYYNGAHSHTPCEPQEKAWCFRRVTLDFGLNDYLDCFPSQSSCQDKLDDLYLEHNIKLTASPCQLIDASEWLARSRLEDRLERGKFLTDYSECTGDAVRAIPLFLFIPATPPQKPTTMYSCNGDVRTAAAAIEHARTVCNRVVTHRETLAYITAGLDALDHYLRDYPAQVCNEARLKCEHVATDIQCFLNAGWPQLEAPDIHYLH